MEQKQLVKKRRKYNRKKILLAGILLLVASVLVIAGVLLLLQNHKNDKVYNKEQIAETTSVLGVIEIKPLTDEERNLLDDYRLVLEMLSQQDMTNYSEELLARIQEQLAFVQDKLDYEELNGMEDAINQLAALIDEPLYNGDVGGVFYARGILILNKQHTAPPSFAPGDRVIMTNAFAAMQAAAANDGVNLYDFSNYRSYYAQETLYARYVAQDGEAEANRYSAKAGYSEHQTGFVMDIGGDNRGAWAETTFDDTKEAHWLAEHAHEYGFIMRYPPEKEDITGYMYESWHFRYIGPIATKVYESGLSLEEYLQLV